MPKIMHIADLHLDSRFTGLTFDEAIKRRADLRDVFKNTLAIANKHGCVLTIISGDLFDSEYYTLDTLKFLSECFSAMPKHKFVIAAGNHDPLTSASPYRYADFPSNVYMFKSDSLSRFDFDDIGISVYGYSFTSDYYGRDPLQDISITPGTENFNVLCAHTELDSVRSPYAPISTASLAASGFDYAALGHIHKSEGVKKAGQTLYAYSGCLAGRDFSEDGEKGGIIISLDRVGTKKTVTATSVRLCPWVYNNISVSVTGLASEDAIVDAIQKKLEKLQADSSLEYITRVILNGQAGIPTDKNALLARLEPFGVKQIKNETFFVHQSLFLEDDYSLRGEFYRTLKPLLDSPDSKQRKQAEQALNYGLTALANGQIEI